jgi:hypothetical protein
MPKRTLNLSQAAMFSSIFADVSGKYDHVTIASRKIQNQVIYTWLLCLYRLRQEIKNKPRSAIDSSVPMLPKEVKTYINSFLGDGLDLVPSMMPAKALKALALSRRQARKMEMNMALRIFLNNLNVELMTLCDQGKLTGQIPMPPELMATIEAFDVAVRDGKSTYKVIVDAIEEQGYTILSTSCSCNGHTNSVCGGHYLAAVTLSWQ